MADSGPPPIRWLFGNAEQRGHAWRYWVLDTCVGAINTGLYYSFRLLPIDTCSAIGGALGALSKYRYLESDARAREVWMRLRPQDADKASTDDAMGRLWRNVGRTMAEFSVLDRIWPAGRISVVGMENLDAARATGQPLIGLSLHLGNWETVPATALALGFHGASIYVPPENRFDHSIANRARDSIQGDYIKADRNTGLEALKVLVKKKQNLLMFVDEFARGRVWAPAFGRALRPEGNIAYILRIARMARARIVPLYSVRLDGRARFQVTVLPMLEAVDTGDRDADLMANVARIDAMIDPIVRAHLDQWYYALDFEFDS